MTQVAKIDAPDSPACDALCEFLAERADQTDLLGEWPAEQIDRCGRQGVFEWFVPADQGGQGWTEADLARGYLRLSAACLTTTFILTQLTGALRRISAIGGEALREKMLPRLLRGAQLSTLAISHLTTSRRHLAEPALRAIPTAGGFRLEGYSPWATGAIRADSLVTGAVLPDGNQVLLVVPTDLPGVSVDPPLKLVALSAGLTGAVRFEGVEVAADWLLDGPAPDVLRSAAGAATGGLQTSTLAIGLSAACIGLIEDQARRRDDLLAPAAGLRRDHAQLRADLLALAAGEPACGAEQLRTRANSLVLRASQAALTAAKGTGFVQGRPAGRWCREALFFLVWSCPQPVLAANLCELAGLAE